MTDQERRTTDSILLDRMSQLQKDIAIMKETMSLFEARAEYIDLLIAREKDRAAMRRAIIEKTLTSLVWSAIIGTGYAIWHTITGK